MRHRVSITIDEDTLQKIRDSLRSKTYRNKSHFFEIAANKLLKEEKSIPDMFKEMLFHYLKDDRNNTVIDSLQNMIPSFINSGEYTCLECGKKSKQTLWHCPDCGAWESCSLIQN